MHRKTLLQINLCTLILDDLIEEQYMHALKEIPKCNGDK